jgi:hypothetical protein
MIAVVPRQSMKNFFWLILITFFGLVCRSAGAAEFQASQCVQAENDGFTMLLGLFSTNLSSGALGVDEISWLAGLKKQSHFGAKARCLLF